VWLNGSDDVHRLHPQGSVEGGLTTGRKLSSGTERLGSAHRYKPVLAVVILARYISGSESRDDPWCIDQGFAKSVKALPADDRVGCLRRNSNTS